MDHSNFLKLINLLALALVILAGCSQENRPDNNLVQAEAYMDVAELYLDQGQFRSSMIEAQNALQMVPRYERAQILIARTNLEIGANNQAIEILNGLNQQEPGNGEINLLLAEAYQNAGNQQAVISLLENVQMQDTNEQQQLNWLLGNAYAINGNQQAADSQPNYHLPKMICQ